VKAGTRGESPFSAQGQKPKEGYEMKYSVEEVRTLKAKLRELNRKIEVAVSTGDFQTRDLIYLEKREGYDRLLEIEEKAERAGIRAHKLYKELDENDPDRAELLRIMKDSREVLEELGDWKA
jgi:hypothetical protein